MATPTRSLGFALLLWLIASAAAVAAAGESSQLGLAVGLAGGAVFGIAAARRVDPRRRRSRRSRSGGVRSGESPS
jgi:hypothetical protein